MTTTPIASVANPTAAWTPALTRVSDRAVSEIGTAITADNAAMPMIDPTPNTPMKMNPRPGVSNVVAVKTTSAAVPASPCISPTRNVRSQAVFR